MDGIKEAINVIVATAISRLQSPTQVITISIFLMELMLKELGKKKFIKAKGRLTHFHIHLPVLFLFLILLFILHTFRFIMLSKKKQKMNNSIIYNLLLNAYNIFYFCTLFQISSHLYEF